MDDKLDWIHRTLKDAADMDCGCCQSNALTSFHTDSWIHAEVQGKYSKIKVSMRLTDCHIEVINGPQILSNCRTSDKETAWERESKSPGEGVQ